MIASLLRKVAVELALPLVLFTLLYLVSANSTNFFFPSLASVLDKFSSIWLGPRFVSDVIPSFQRLMAGYLLACLFGITLGVLIGVHAPLRRATEPVLEFFRAVPPVAMIVTFGSLWAGCAQARTPVISAAMANMDLRDRCCVIFPPTEILKAYKVVSRSRSRRPARHS